MMHAVVASQLPASNQRVKASQQLTIAKRLIEQTENGISIYTLTLDIAGRPPTNITQVQGDHTTAFAILNYSVEGNVNGYLPEVALMNMISLFDSVFTSLQAQNVIYEAIQKYNLLVKDIPRDRTDIFVTYYVADRVSDIVVDLANIYLTARNKQELTAFISDDTIKPEKEEGAMVKAAKIKLIKYTSQLKDDPTQKLDDLTKNDIINCIYNLLHYPWVPTKLTKSPDADTHTDKNSASNKVNKKNNEKSKNNRDNDANKLIQVLAIHMTTVWQSFPQIFERWGDSGVQDLITSFMDKFLDFKDNKNWLAVFRERICADPDTYDEEEMYDFLRSQKQLIIDNIYDSLPVDIKSIDDTSTLTGSQASNRGTASDIDMDDNLSISSISISETEAKSSLSGELTDTLWKELQRRYEDNTAAVESIKQLKAALDQGTFTKLQAK